MLRHSVWRFVHETTVQEITIIRSIRSFEIECTEKKVKQKLKKLKAVGWLVVKDVYDLHC